MSEQHQMGPGPLLDEKGNLAEPGYAFSLVKRYDRHFVRVRKSRIKEWDYYYVGNKDYGVALTVADNGYMSLVSVSLLEFGDKPFEASKSLMGLFPMGKLDLPGDSRMGDVEYGDKKGNVMRFYHDGAKRHLVCQMKDVGAKGRWFRCDITLAETNPKSMVIATPFKKRGHFYYNQKINNLKAAGYAKLGDRMYDFNNNSYGVLDWGRGVWTYRNTWYWSSLSSVYKGRTIGWNLGYGFGNTAAASENMLFIDQKAIKLDDVKFDIPMNDRSQDDYMKPWKFRSSKGDISLTFTPVYDRNSDDNLLLIRSKQHQVFGRFSGYFLVEGEQVYFEDLPGFAEKVFNKW